METKGVFSIWNHHKCLGSSHSSWILPSGLWVYYGHYKYFISFSAGTVFIRQNLTSTDVRFWCIKTVPALKGCTVKYALPTLIIYNLRVSCDLTVVSSEDEAMIWSLKGLHLMSSMGPVCPHTLGMLASTRPVCKHSKRGQQISKISHVT